MKKRMISLLGRQAIYAVQEDFDIHLLIYKNDAIRYFLRVCRYPDLDLSKNWSVKITPDGVQAVENLNEIYEDWENVFQFDQPDAKAIAYELGLIDEMIPEYRYHDVIGAYVPVACEGLLGIPIQATNLADAIAMVLSFPDDSIINCDSQFPFDANDVIGYVHFLETDYVVFIVSHG